jgi:hypothetical protein
MTSFSRASAAIEKRIGAQLASVCIVYPLGDRPWMTVHAAIISARSRRCPEVGIWEACPPSGRVTRDSDEALPGSAPKTIAARILRVADEQD